MPQRVMFPSEGRPTLGLSFFRPPVTRRPCPSAYYFNSEAFYKMLMMAVVLYEDYGVRYNPKLITSPKATAADDHFFADSRGRATPIYFVALLETTFAPMARSNFARAVS